MLLPSNLHIYRQYNFEFHLLFSSVSSAGCLDFALVFFHLFTDCSHCAECFLVTGGCSCPRLYVNLSSLPGLLFFEPGYLFVHLRSTFEVSPRNASWRLIYHASCWCPGSVIIVEWLLVEFTFSERYSLALGGGRPGCLESRSSSSKGRADHGFVFHRQMAP